MFYPENFTASFLVMFEWILFLPIIVNCLNVCQVEFSAIWNNSSCKYPNISHIQRRKNNINAMKMLMIKQLMFVGIDIVWRLGCSIDKARERGGTCYTGFHNYCGGFHYCGGYQLQFRLVIFGENEKTFCVGEKIQQKSGLWRKYSKYQVWIKSDWMS